MLVSDLLDSLNKKQSLTESELRKIKKELELKRVYENSLLELERNPIVHQYFKALQEIKSRVLLEKVIGSMCEHILIPSEKEGKYQCLRCGYIHSLELRTNIDFSSYIFPIENISFEKALELYEKAVLEANERESIVLKMQELYQENKAYCKKK